MFPKNDLTKNQKALLYGGLTIAGLAYAGPILAIAALAASNLVEIAICGVALFAGLAALPWASLKWKNIVLKLIKDEARDKPIETMQNEYGELFQNSQIVVQREADLIGMRGSLVERIEEFESKHGTRDSNMEEMLTGITNLIHQVTAERMNLEKELSEFEKTIEIERDRFAIAKESGEIADAINKARGNNNPQRKFIRTEALDGVRDRYNSSMARINQLLNTSPVALRLSSDKKIDGAVDVTPIKTIGPR